MKTHEKIREKREEKKWSQDNDPKNVGNVMNKNHNPIFSGCQKIEQNNIK